MYTVTLKPRGRYLCNSGDDGERDAENLKKDLSNGWKNDWNYFTTDDIMTSPDVDEDFRGLKLPKEVVESIYYKNAERLFK